MTQTNNTAQTNNRRAEFHLNYGTIVISDRHLPGYQSIAVSRPEQEAGSRLSKAVGYISRLVRKSGRPVFDTDTYVGDDTTAATIQYDNEAKKDSSARSVIETARNQGIDSLLFLGINPNGVSSEVAVQKTLGAALGKIRSNEGIRNIGVVCLDPAQYEHAVSFMYSMVSRN